MYDAVVAGVAAGAERIRIGDGTDPASECGPMVSAAQRARTEEFVASALAEGARLVAGGRRPDEPELQAGFFYRPTVFADCTREMRVVREEVFGPVLTVERFSTEQEAVRAGQRHRLRPRRRRVDLRHRPGAPGRRRPAPRHGVDQRLPPVRPAGRVGRLRPLRQRP